MERFDESIRTTFADHTMPSDIEARLDTLARLRVPECDGYGLSPVSTSPATVCCLLQSGLRRAIELTEAAIREINRRNLVSSALLARAVLETSCLLWDVMLQVEKVVQEADTHGLKPLHQVLNKALFGGKAKSVMLDEAIEARNVLTIIQRLTKSKGIPLEGFYERLSEYAHPNYHGMMATYTEAGFTGTIKTFCDRRPSAERALISTALGAIAVSCSLVIESFTILAAQLRGFAELAEREIREKGEWPADTEYPVPRS